MSEATTRDDSIPVRDDPRETERSGARRGDPGAIRCDTARYRTIRVRYGPIPVRDGSIPVRDGSIPAPETVYAEVLHAEELDWAFNLPGLQQEVSEGRTPLLGQ